MPLGERGPHEWRSESEAPLLKRRYSTATTREKIVKNDQYLVKT